MTPNETITHSICHAEPLKILSPGTVQSTYILECFPSIVQESIRNIRNQRKECRSKRQISVELNATRMEKNDPTLPTWDTLKVRLQRLLRNPRRKCAPTARNQSQRVRKTPPPNESIIMEETPSSSYSISPVTNK